jgi:hypothetical protein
VTTLAWYEEDGICREAVLLKLGEVPADLMARLPGSTKQARTGGTRGTIQTALRRGSEPG